MTCGIYYILNTETKHVYIGSSIDIEKRIKRHKHTLTHNMHHNIYLQRAWSRYGQDAFLFGILEITSKEELLTTEQTYLDLNENGYNLAPAAGGDILLNHPNKENIIKAMTESVRKRYKNMTSEEKKKIHGKPGSLNGMYGRTHTDEVKRKSSEMNKNNQYAKGMVLTAEQKAKLSEFAKTRTGEKNSFYGKQHSPEIRSKLSELKKLRDANMTIQEKLDHPQIRFVEINGIIYSGVSAAARDINVCSATICYRIKSKNEMYNDYKYVDSTYVKENMEKIKR